MDACLLTPFREHYEHCRALDLEGQLRECTDHLQHPDVLMMEFFESYHLIERSFEPDQGLRREGEDDELVLESFYESLELSIHGREDKGAAERLICVSGSMSPIPEANHPALSRRGLDYVGLRGGETLHIVLGVAQSSKEDTPYVMLLRALNCLAELSPPFRVVQLGRELIRGQIPENVRFDLHVGITDLDPSDTWVALIELTRDLAEMFKRQVGGHPQFRDMLGHIECVEIEPSGSDGVLTLERLWSV